MFEQVVTMNEAFGNPKGNPDEIDFSRLSKQCNNILDEYEELMGALSSENITQIRDALCDIMVFSLGAFHLMGINANADMNAVFNSNMSKFCKTKEAMDLTKAKYSALGVPWYEEGNKHGNYLKCAEDFTDANGNQYRKGKFLKGVEFKEPTFPDPGGEVNMEALLQRCEYTWNTCYPERRKWADVGAETQDEWVRVFSTFLPYPL
jgi:hypothetical protein